MLSLLAFSERDRYEYFKGSLHLRRHFIFQLDVHFQVFQGASTLGNVLLVWCTSRSLQNDHLSEPACLMKTNQFTVILSNK